MSLRLEDLPPEARARVLASDSGAPVEPAPLPAGISWAVSVERPAPPPRAVEPARVDPEADMRWLRRRAVATAAAVGFAAYGYGAAEYMDWPLLLGAAASLATGVTLWAAWKVINKV